MVSPIDVMYSGSAPVRGGRALPSTAPAWLAGRVANKWMQPGTATVASIDPALNASINPNVGQSDPRAPWAMLNSLANSTNDYSGATWDEVRQRMAIFDGGHAGFFGNFGSSYTFEAAAPFPTIHGVPSGSIPKPCASMTANGSLGSLLVDERPHMVHTYNLLVTLPSGDVVMLPGGYTWQGYSANEGYRFDMAANDWDTTNKYVSPAAVSAFGGGCYDPVRNVIWHLNGDKMFKWTGNVGSYVYYLNAGGAAYVKLIYDTKRNLVVCFHQSTSLDGHSGFVFLYDPTAPTAGFKSITITGGTATNWSQDGVAYDELRDRYLIWRGGAAIKVLTPPASGPDTNAWVLSDLTTDSTAVTPSASVPNGVYGRFAISKKYDFAVGVNRLDERPFVLPLS